MGATPHAGRDATGSAGQARSSATPGAAARAAGNAIVAAGFFGFTGVAAGAFGAHALKARLDPDALAVFDTAARYQMLHALALLATAWVCQQWPGRAARASGVLFGAGIVLFSGSLYALSLTGIRGLGAITPVGGLLFILGWLALMVAGVRARSP
jgi:uncharacterized membrane protein YgdD (TMEM256/DUF423 family)